MVTKLMENLTSILNVTVKLKHREFIIGLINDGEFKSASEFIRSLIDKDIKNREENGKEKTN